MAKGLSVVLIFAFTVVGQALTPSSYFTAVDQTRLRQVFEGAKPYGEDLQSVYYSVLGYTLLGDKIDGATSTCDIIKKHVDAKSVESIFYATSTAHLLKTHAKANCQLSISGAEKLLNDAITEESTTNTIYQAVASLTNLGSKVDAGKVKAALEGALNNDDAPLSHGYGFHAAALLSGDLKKFHDFIEDVVAQADEVDDKFLQFEGGLYTTAIVVDGAYKLAATANKAPTLTEDKVIKFANYFLSRKHAQLLKNAVAILSVIKTLTDNKYHIPIAVTLASQVSVSNQANVVQVRVSNLLGNSLGKLTVAADTARHLGDDAVVLSKMPFAASSKDSSLYELDFMKVKPARGFYKIIVSATPQKADARLIGTSGAEVEVKVTTQVAIEDVTLGVGDRDQISVPKNIQLQHPNKAANVLEADHQQKIVMKFQLKDKVSGTTMTAHQAFVRLTYLQTRQEVIFVAESDSADMYKFDLDVGAKAKEFGSLSGKYSMELIIGDAVIENPFSWTLADVALTFQDSASPSSAEDRYAKKPDIEHMFREPEKRPPAAVSSLFTALVLSPILILLILWLRIGVNVSNFPMSVSALGFHLGLAAIFGLYYCYWTHLNMFTTLRYVGILGVPTFLFGNRLLSSIASKRK